MSTTLARILDEAWRDARYALRIEPAAALRD